MAELIRPRALTPGGTIGVAAVSGPVDEAKLEAGLARLRAKGYRIVEASNLRSRSGFLAGSDAERAAGYRELVRNPEVEAILFARGGYGAGRILPLLDARETRANAKVHLGGSDLTALFAWLTRQVGLVAFYGPMVAVEMPGEDGLDWEEVLSRGLPEPQRFSASQVLAPGRWEGPLVGGCLSLLASLCGTPEAVAVEGSILFWEDIGEPIYRLDRMLLQLERSGTFGKLGGMVIGSIVPSAGEVPDQVAAWLADRFAGAPFPIVRGLPAGHVQRPRTLPLGLRVRLEAGSEIALTFLEAAVEGV